MLRKEIILTLWVVFGSQCSWAQAVCATCHPKETAAYLSSFMGRSIGGPDHVPPGKVSDSQSGSLIRVEWRNGKMVHTLSEDGLDAEYEIRYRIGAGKVGYSYAAQVGDVLLQSPASYFKKYGWDVSPGFAGAELLDFNRVLTNRCLFCHSNARGSPNGRGLGGQELASIGCERCHGDTSEHLRHPAAANVVNPAKLTIRARDSVCEQCHLEGLARILNPGKALYDFKPGMNLEAVVAIYVEKNATPGVKAVSQAEQLASSKCSQSSNGKLWCGTCHNPHGPATNRSAEIKTICTSCHNSLSPSKHSRVSECTSCHMPQSAPADVAHAALTDHQILAKPESVGRPALSGSEELRAWHEPNPDFEQRDLALAYFEAGENSGNRRHVDLGRKLLASLPLSQLNDDASVNGALGDIALAEGRPGEAANFFRRGSELDKSSARFAMLLGVALKQDAHFDEAISSFRRAIRLDPSLERSYLELSSLYAKEGKLNEAREILDEFLKWNPKSILVRLTRNSLTGGKN